MIKAVIFDLGFTLVGNENFTIPRYLKMIEIGINNVAKYLVEINQINEKDKNKFIRIFKKIRYSSFDKVFNESIEYSTEDCLKNTFDKFNIDYKNNNLINKCAGIFHVVEGDFWKPFPNTERTLQELKKMNIKIGLLSNGPYDKGIKKLLEIYNLKKYFDVVETSANIGYTKPNPITFMTILEELNLKPDEGIMVGDDLLNDCKGASDVGMLCVKVKKSFNFPYENDLEFKPDYIINDISEIVNIIKQLNKK
ncbi:MAG: HAD family hydrolase [Candidatus Helarchaeota archaeon]